MKIRTIIADDEPLAREKIRGYLTDKEAIEVVAECGDGLATVRAVEEYLPELLFLDVQMPELDGFGVLKALESDSLPAVIFVTAFDRYALRAFDVHALDYLLKPFDRARFSKALQRAQKQIMEEKERSRVSANLAALVEELRRERTGDRRYLERLVIKEAGRVFFLKVNEIKHIEAAGNYIRLHDGGESHLLRETMNGIEAKLHPEHFIRIHRSIIVRIDCIKEFQPWFNGEYVIKLQDGTELTSSRSYRSHIAALLDKES